MTENAAFESFVNGAGQSCTVVAAAPLRFDEVLNVVRKNEATENIR